MHRDHIRLDLIRHLSFFFHPTENPSPMFNDFAGVSHVLLLSFLPVFIQFTNPLLEWVGMGGWEGDGSNEVLHA